MSSSATPAPSRAYTAEEKAWLKQHYGGEFRFLRSHMLSIYKDEDREEGRSIARALMDYDNEESADSSGNNLDHIADHHFDGPELDMIRKDFGDSGQFMSSYGLKMYDDDDCEEAKAIARAFVDQDRQAHEDENCPQLGPEVGHHHAQEVGLEGDRLIDTNDYDVPINYHPIAYQHPDSREYYDQPGFCDSHEAVSADVHDAQGFHPRDHYTFPDHPNHDDDSHSGNFNPHGDGIFTSNGYDDHGGYCGDDAGPGGCDNEGYYDACDGGVDNGYSCYADDGGCDYNGDYYDDGY